MIFSDISMFYMFLLYFSIAMTSGTIAFLFVENSYQRDAEDEQYGEKIPHFVLFHTYVF